MGTRESVSVHPSKDNFVSVAAVKTVQGTYKRNITELTVLLPQEKKIADCLNL